MRQNAGCLEIYNTGEAQGVDRVRPRILSAFVPGRASDWAAPTPCPSGRAVRAVTGAAKPHGVIHRNIFNSCEAWSLIR